MAQPNSYPGVLIAFEGPSPGQRAQSLDAVTSTLQAYGQEVLVSRWMSSALAGDVYAKSAPLFQLSPRTLALLAACDVAERIEWDILPALQAGKVVLADRYIYRVALGAARDVDPEWLEVLCGAGPVPDLILSFPIPLADPATKVDPESLDLYEAGMDIGMTHDLPLSFRLYQERLHDGYTDWAERHALQIEETDGPTPAVARVTSFLGLSDRGLDQRRLAVLQLLQESGVDTLHARHVARLARQLFDLTKERHLLTRMDADLLEYACLLHDVAGSEIGLEHPSRSARRVRESHLPGFELEELNAMAVLIAIHRAIDERTAAEEWLRQLSPDLQKKVQLLGPLLRLADGLDASRRRVVRSVQARIHDGLFSIVLQARTKAKVEIRAAVQRADLFEEAYGLHLTIDVNRNGPPPAGKDLLPPSLVSATER